MLLYDVNFIKNIRRSDISEMDEISETRRSAVERRKWLSRLRRVVLKVGTQVLIDDAGRLEPEVFARLAREVSKIEEECGISFIVVTSGAIMAGRARVGLEADRDSIPVKQAMAAIGQPEVMRFYGEFFKHYGRIVGQILLTRDDLESRRRYLNARHTIENLLKMKVIPIINENDTVMVEEIKFGDNDNLSAMVTSLVDADLLLILSDVEGLYDVDPAKDSNAKVIPFVEKVDEKVEALAGGARKGVGLGGMVTKVQAAKRAARYGIPTVIARGKRPGIIRSVLKGEPVGTFFAPAENRLSSRKHWIAYTTREHGQLVIDEGARKAMVEGGKSLLPSGVVKVEGRFEKGDTVCCITEDGKVVARGITNYSSAEIKKIKGLHTSEIADVLGYKITDEVIHRDDLVIL